MVMIIQLVSKVTGLEEFNQILKSILLKHSQYFYTLPKINLNQKDLSKKDSY
jgi:hypothetical protein